MLDPPVPVHVCMISPGPVSTSLASEAPIKAALALVRDQSRWSDALLRLVATIELYNRKFSIAPQTAAEAITRVIHAVDPPQRTIVNMTWPMRLAGHLPQTLIDRQATKKKLGATMTVASARELNAVSHGRMQAVCFG